MASANQAEQAMEEDDARLRSEMVDAMLLQRLSADMARADEAQTLYEKLMDAAVCIMRSDFASMQMFFPERGANGELLLLAQRGFNPEAAKFWEWVRADSESICGMALRTRARSVAPDVQTYQFLADSEALATYLQTGIHAVQSTPLISRSSNLLGMISTHWKTPHEPSERDWRMFDVLARHAADLIERLQTDAALRESEERQAFLLKLSDALRPLADPVAIQGEACRLLGEHLGVDRCGYAEIDASGEFSTIHRDYCRPGVPLMAGRFRLDGFGKPLIDRLREGQNFILGDAATELHLTEPERIAYATLQVRAAAAVPLTKAGRLRALLFVNNRNDAHVWSAKELRLVKDVAERTWTAVERARAEQSLASSEAKYRTLFNSMDEGYCIIEVLFDAADKPFNWRFLKVNPAFEKHIGLVGATGKTILDLTPDIESKWFDIYGRVARTGEPLRFEEHSAALDRWFDLYAFRVGAPEENKVAVLFSNITERKQAEAGNAQLAAIVESSNEAIISKDLNGTILTWNTAGQRLFGYTAEEAVGQSVTLLMPPERAHEEEDILRRIGQGKRIEHFETVRRRKDGTAVDISLTISPIRNGAGKIVGASKIARNITKRKRIQRLIQEQRRILELIAKGEPIERCLEELCLAIERIDPRVRACVLLAKGGRSAFSRVIAPRFPRLVEALQNLPLGDGWIGTCAQLVVSGQPMVCADVANDPRWQEDWCSLCLAYGILAGYSSPIVQAEASPLGSVFLCFNAPKEPTDWDQRLADVATSTAGIALQREQAKQALCESMERLREADRRKTEFLATLAHELRNPLAPIRTGLEVMKLAADDPAAMKDVRETMERQIGQLVRLIDDLLEVSRITRGKLELRTSRVALADVVRSAVEATRPFIDAAGHELTVRLPSQPIFLDVDSNRLTQVFSNLLNNATKYTPNGGNIWLSGERQDSDVVVTIKDDGIGIPIDMQTWIFEMFTQVDRSFERTYKGLGIGLTLVQQLVEMHGGRVEARSEGEGKGSEFSVRLPILVDPRAEGAEAPPVQDQAAARKRKLRILVVDDNAPAADMLSTLLKMHGNDVRTATDGQHAIEVAAEFLPDLVLMDIGMPKMDGYEAARRIREQEWGKDMVLVALTGFGQEEDRQRTEDTGFDHHLVKPVEPAELQRFIAELKPTSPSE